MRRFQSSTGSARADLGAGGENPWARGCSLKGVITRSKTSDQGAAIVEAALTLLVFLMLLFGIIEGGRVLNVQQTLTGAAREGARLSVAPLSGSSTLVSTTEIENEVNKALNAASIRGASITVERPVSLQSGEDPTEFTRVRVSLKYSVLTLSMFRTLQVTLTGEALMRNETSP